MKINPPSLNPNLTPSQIYQMVNDLVLDVEGFSEIACLNGRAFGVVTTCDTCELDLNACLRNAMWQQLINSQDKLERVIGYNLTERYHMEEIPWDGANRILAGWPGVESVNVQLQYADIEDYGPFDISPYLIEDVPLTNYNDEYCIATLDAELVGNPNHITFRNSSGAVIRRNELSGFPRKDVNGDWEVALHPDKLSTPCDDTVNAQHCKYMILEVGPATCANGEVVPVYVGTNQIIPQARPVETLPGGNLRYWFHPWVLVNQAFGEEQIDLTRAEFYKLEPQIAFKCVTEVSAPPVVIQYNACECGTAEEADPVNDPVITMSVYHAKDGILEICPTDTCNSGVCSACHQAKRPAKIRFYYKTNPSLLNLNTASFGFREAVAYLTAANLPMGSCGCELRDGFIKEAQSAYTDIRVNPVTGENIVNLRYGNMHGHLVFAERLKDAPHYYRLNLL